MPTTLCRRFWYSREDELTVDEDGFLWLPRNEFTQHVNAHVVDLAQLRSLACLALLGEPGSGKSTALGVEKEAVVADGEAVVDVDLGSVASDESLARAVFGGAVWGRWREGQCLTIFLDAYDECRLSLRNVGQVLIRELKALPTRDRISLRLACRTAVWPAYLDDQLRQLWNEDYRVYNLAPLQRSDASTIAVDCGVADDKAFLEAIANADAMPFATSPLSVQTLAHIYRQTGTLPARRSQFYEQGCLALCTEGNISRQARGAATLTAEQRLAVASRLAALTVLCGRTGIWLGAQTMCADNSLLPLDAAVGDTESANGAIFEVTLEAVRETLEETGLFSPRGAETLTWTHRSYAEFLAARYIKSRSMPIEQVRGLLGHPGAVTRLVPQLRGVAACLATEAEILDFISQAEPGILFEIDATELDEANRERLVVTILEAANEGRIVHGPMSRLCYQRLVHDGLAKQVLPVIQDRSRHVVQRQLALNIGAIACLGDIEGALLNLALDGSETLPMRISAAGRLGHSKNRELRKRLLEVFSGDLAQDADDEFRGAVLKAVWPDAVSAVDILPHLLRQKRASHNGRYGRFLRHEFVDDLPASDLCPALEWVKGLPRDQTCHLPFSLVRDQVLVRAWQALGLPGIEAAFAAAFWRKVEQRDTWISDGDLREQAEELTANAASRQTLLSVLLRHPIEGSQHGSCLRAFHPSLVRREDLPWLLGLLDTELTAQARAILIDIVEGFFLPDAVDDCDQILLACDWHPDLRESLAHRILPVAVASPEAERMRKYYKASQEWQPSGQGQERLDPPPRERVLDVLAHAQQHPTKAWIHVTYELTLTPDSTYYGNIVAYDLSSQSGWREADDSTRERLVQLADVYLRRATPLADAWFDKPDHTGGDYAIAGMKAIWLLRRQAPDQFAIIGAETWKTWMPAILGCQAFDSETDDADTTSLISDAYRAASGCFRGWLERWLVRENTWASQQTQDDDQPRFHILPDDLLSKLSACWDSDIAELLRWFASRPDVTDVVYATILDQLIKQGDPAAISDIRDQLAALPDDPAATRRLTIAASRLLAYLPGTLLPDLRPLERIDDDFCRTVLQLWAEDRPLAVASELARMLSEDDCADFCLMLHYLFPAEPNEDDEYLSLRGVVARLVQELPDHLASRGTFAAVAAIDRILAEFPNNLSLRAVRLRAERLALEATWAPPDPGDLLCLVRDSRKRLVRGGDELLAILKESIRRFEAELQGETPLSFTLWNEQRAGRGKQKATTFRPKEEERLSDLLRGHLVRDLVERAVVVNREVQIRPRQGKQGSPGEITDIHIDAVTRDTDRMPGAVDIVQAIAEVKGCWNNDVTTAMKDQLRDRYLRDNNCQHGLYVVGWFLCDQWDENDYRKAEAVRRMPPSLEEARAFFDKQAAELSRDDPVIGSYVIHCSLR